jgi:internalin A
LKPLVGLNALQNLGLSFRQVVDLSPLTELTGLQVLDLYDCDRLVDLRPLAGLTWLQELYLSGCGLLSDLSPLPGLTGLRTLHLDDRLGIRRFGSIKCLLPTLEKLSLFGCKFDDLPSEICGENVLHKVRAHLA